MVGALLIFSPLKHLRHGYSIFRRSDGRVLALVILVYVSHKQEFGMTRPSCRDISWWKYEDCSSETRSGLKITPMGSFRQTLANFYSVALIMADRLCFMQTTT